MKYFISLIVLFSAPAFAEVLNANYESKFTHQNGIIQVSQKQKKRVTMYSTNHCPFCKQARNYFRANRIPYLERNIDRSRFALRQFEAMNSFGTPTFVVSKRKLVGFSVARFRNFYR